MGCKHGAMRQVQTCTNWCDTCTNMHELVRYKSLVLHPSPLSTKQSKTTSHKTIMWSSNTSGTSGHRSSTWRLQGWRNTVRRFSSCHIIRERVIIQTVICAEADITGTTADVINMASHCASICQLDVIVAESFLADDSHKQSCLAIHCKIANPDRSVNIKLSATGVSVMVRLLPVLFVVDFRRYIRLHDIKVRPWTSAHEQFCW